MNAESVVENGVEEKIRGMDHFINIARRGRPNSGASGGEVRARKLALSMLENAAGLDDEAIEGARNFLRLAQYRPSLARQILGIR